MRIALKEPKEPKEPNECVHYEKQNRADVSKPIIYK
jgi:hypothetical protein